MINQRRGRRAAFCSKFCLLGAIVLLCGVGFFVFHATHTHREVVNESHSHTSEVVGMITTMKRPSEAPPPQVSDQHHQMANNEHIDGSVNLKRGHIEEDAVSVVSPPHQPNIIIPPSKISSMHLERYSLSTSRAHGNMEPDIPSKNPQEKVLLSESDKIKLETVSQLKDQTPSSLSVQDNINVKLNDYLENTEPKEIVLNCNGEKKTLADFTESTAPDWLKRSRDKCDTLAACLWYGCAEKCFDRGISSSISSVKIKGSGDTLLDALSKFDKSGTISVTSPTGGSMVVQAGNEVGEPFHVASPQSGGISIEPVDIIVTFTSLPGRLSHTKDTINSLRAQTLPPKVIVVSVPITSGRKENKGEYVIPNFLLSTPGVCVLRTPIDYGPATKLMGFAKQLHSDGLILDAPRKNADDVSKQDSIGRSGGGSSRESSNKPHHHSKMRIVVVDDDTWYPPRMVEALFRWSMRLPNAVIAQHGWVPSVALTYKGNKKNPENFPLHYWGRHLTEPRPVSVVTGNTGYMLQPRHVDSLFWSGLERKDEDAQQQKFRKMSMIDERTKASNDKSKVKTSSFPLFDEIAFDAQFFESASNSAKYMDDVWISGHFSRKNVIKFAVPMDRNEDRARWSGGGDGPSLDTVGGIGRGDMNENALKEFEGLWDVLRCSKQKDLVTNSIKSVVKNRVLKRNHQKASLRKLSSFVGEDSISKKDARQCYGPLSLHFRCCEPFSTVRAMLNVSLEQYIQS